MQTRRGFLKSLLIGGAGIAIGGTAVAKAVVPSSQSIDGLKWKLIPITIAGANGMSERAWVYGIEMEDLVNVDHDSRYWFKEGAKCKSL